jgi:hypothetical protein
MGWLFKVTQWLLHDRERGQVQILYEDEWNPGLVWMLAENPIYTGIRCQEHSALDKSPYRLRYPSHDVDYAVKSRGKAIPLQA